MKQNRFAPERRAYQKPTMRVVLLQQRHHLLDTSDPLATPPRWGSKDSENPYDFD